MHMAKKGKEEIDFAKNMKITESQKALSSKVFATKKVTFVSTHCTLCKVFSLLMILAKSYLRRTLL